jgi:hypothetical protein
LIFSQGAQVVVGVILLYTCRQFERQMGTRKFAGFFVYSFLFSQLSSIAVMVIASSIGMKLSISSGPYFIIFAQLFMFYSRIPKMPTSSPTSYSLFGLGGVEFSEKSWIYLLASQLMLSEGLKSFVPSFIGLIAGYLYDNDRYSLQTFRLPRIVEVPFAFLGSFFSFFSPPPAAPPAGSLPALATLQGRQPVGAALRRAGSDRSLGGSGGGGLQSDLGGIRHRTSAPPNEESVAALMGMGFDREAAVRALQNTGNNVEAAANFLLTNN